MFHLLLPENFMWSFGFKQFNALSNLLREYVQRLWPFVSPLNIDVIFGKARNFFHRAKNLLGLILKYVNLEKSRFHFLSLQQMNFEK